MTAQTYSEVSCNDVGREALPSIAALTATAVLRGALDPWKLSIQEARALVRLLDDAGFHGAAERVAKSLNN